MPTLLCRRDFLDGFELKENNELESDLRVKFFVKKAIRE